MNISVLTLFPELYKTFFKTSLIGKAEEKGLIHSNIISIFDFANPKERIDSPGYGPGAGMLIKPEIIDKAIKSIEKTEGSTFKIFFSPQGKKLNQNLLKSIKDRLNGINNILLIAASRYEGIDSRVEDYYADEIISLGDFVLMGADLPALCFIESFLRLIPGIVGKKESVEKESFSGPFIDYPQFTEPVIWNDLKVPDVLRSGNHKLIDEWRNEQAALKTVKNHFNWLRSYQLDQQQKSLVQKYIPSHYTILMHSDVLLKDKSVGTTSVTSLDIHDIARSSATYGIKNYFISTPLSDQQNIVNTLLNFWKIGFGADYNINRTIAINKIILVNSLNDAIDEIFKKEEKKPIIIATSAKKSEKYKQKYITFFDQQFVWQFERPVLLLFGTGYGLSEAILDKSDYILNPVSGFSDFNHLSVRSAAAIILDRWLGINIKNGK